MHPEDNEKFGKLHDSPLLENVLRERYVEGFRGCEQFMRHKTTFIHPNVLKAKGVRLSK